MAPKPTLRRPLDAPKAARSTRSRCAAPSARFPKQKRPASAALEPGPTFDALQAKYNRTFPHVLTAKRGIAPSTAVEDARAGNPNDSGKSIDIIKIDIDSCECHILEVLLAERYYRAKIINVEVNHNLPPPIAYREFCVDDAFGRNGGNGQIDVFGCSVQAAYDVLHPHGYELFQYDWPDAVFAWCAT